MNKSRSIFILFVTASLFFSFSLVADEEGKSLCTNKEESKETKHQIIVDGKTLSYTAVIGNLLLRDEKCEPKASLSYISYTKEDSKLESRPITFCFNGGPGSSSVWLHLGVFGPKRIVCTEEGGPKLPYQLVENEYSLLDVSDLVFIDPVSTGFSRAIPADQAKQFHGVDEDIKSIAEFIRLYLTHTNRWESPKFIAGESYGTTRAVGLAQFLYDEFFIGTNGVILISSVLNFQSIDFKKGQDLAYVLFLPTYTATAWYYKKLETNLQANFLETIEASRVFAANEYLPALFKGNQLPAAERDHVAEKLSALTGLSLDYVKRSNLRIEWDAFCKELLHDKKQVIGRFDSRLRGGQLDSTARSCIYDPSMESVFSGFTSTFNHYLQSNLQWKSGLSYNLLVNLQSWNFGQDNQYLDMSDKLHSLMTRNPHLQIFVGNGYYDLATPFFATEYTFHHIGEDASLLRRVSMKYYDAGHMMYLYKPALIKLKKDLADFYAKTLSVKN